MNVKRPVQKRDTDEAENEDNETQQKTGEKIEEETVDEAEGQVPAPVLLCTPGDFIARRDTLDTSHVKSIIIDEPDAMLPPLPGRNLTDHQLKKHPVNRHPPPLVEAINHILDIKTIDPVKQKKKKHWRDKPEPTLNVDFSNRRRVQTVWTSGSLDSALKRFTRSRGWIRIREYVVDLNFTPSATERQIEERRTAMTVEGQAIQVRTEPISKVKGVEPDHYALTVDVDTGEVDLLGPDSSQRSPNGMEEVPLLIDGLLPIEMLEALVMLHTTKPPPKGTYAMATCPEGTSIDNVAAAISNMGVPSLYLDSDMIQDVSSLIPEEDQQVSPILIARRSAVPGLHLPRLHTIYLLGGLSVGDEGRADRIRDKVAFYEVAAGRVGRLGTTTTDKQRVVNLVAKNSRDERVLGELFYGKYSVSGGKEDEAASAAARGETVERRWKLKPWDLEESERILLELGSSNRAEPESAA